MTLETREYLCLESEDNIMILLATTDYFYFLQYHLQKKH